MCTPCHDSFMRLALSEGRIALEAGEIPVGCVFVSCSSGEVLSRGSNLTNETKNGTSHAEMNCIKDMASRGIIDLSDCELYVTCEPCIMCAAALSMLQIKAVYFGCHNDRFGGNGSILSIHQPCFGDNLLSGHHAYPVHAGILKHEAISLFQEFYTTENRRAPETKRRRKGEGKEKDPQQDPQQESGKANQEKKTKI